MLNWKEEGEGRLYGDKKTHSRILVPGLWILVPGWENPLKFHSSRNLEGGFQNGNIFLHKQTQEASICKTGFPEQKHAPNFL